ncbi:MAG: alternative ribosome rescue aminoacyl-tRNA hydrolase ArfB [Polaribacter sp.]|nr:alternative ribosome rescue aminoacyl-tRNA hydrolase ArfB [Polaribacter sp.]MDG1811625.1 alternative ribosome rescue aminoacyl-tRNA hydrolase ArfB [Polaribacter sp.]MDG1994564.1 alternative ribosome rescue aminoacyl-tRNA hydrolase ArfB [Polaribacter sp.]
MNTEKLIKELNFKATRSSGAGGQHVNKVSSKIELFFDVENSNEFSKEQKILLFKNLATRLTKENMLLLTCDESRSQHKNKELVIKRFLEIIKLGLIVPKKRKPTKPSKASIKRKAENKRKQALKKSMRKKPNLE